MPSGAIRLRLLISLCLGIFFLIALICPSNAQQVISVNNQEISPSGIERLLQDLEDPQKLERLRQDLRTLLAAYEAEDIAVVEDPEPRGLAGQLLAIMSSHMQEVNQLLADAGSNLLQVPELGVELVTKAQDPEILRSWAEMAGKVILVLLAGFLAERVVRRLLAGSRKTIEDQVAYNLALRALFLIARTVLELIPIAAFAAAAYGLLPFLDPRTGTQLVALTLVNANILVRVILALARLVLVPGVPSLRILPLDNGSVQYLYIWVRRVAGLGVYGYFILEASLLMGLPGSLYTFLLKFLGLIIAAMAVVLVLQNRSEVTCWLRIAPEKPDEKKVPEKKEKAFCDRIQIFNSIRGRLAEYWHILAIVLITGMYATWALEIEGGFHFLARSVILTILIVALAAFLVRLSMRGTWHLFKISEELKQNHPELEARANRYLPLLSLTIKWVIYVVAVFSIMQAWGLGTLSWLFTPQGGAIISEFLILVFILTAAFLLWELISARIEVSLAKEREEPDEKKRSTRKLTLLPLLRNVILITIALVAGMSVLSHLGVSIAPLLAGAGVIGLAIGFGAQTLVRDVITGAFILIEDSIAVGDWVEAGGHSGTVEHLTVRTVTLRDLTGTVHVIPFGDVTTVLNYNRDYGYALIDARVAYRENYYEVVQALQEVALELRQDETLGPDIIGDLEVFGLNNLGDSAVEIRVRMKTQPMRQFAVRRAFLERVKRIFDERDIEIPFPHRTVWFGTDKEGAAPPMRMTQMPLETLPSARTVIEKPSEEASEPEIQYASESEASRDVVREKEQSEEEEQEQKEKEKSGRDDSNATREDAVARPEDESVKKSG